MSDNQPDPVSENEPVAYDTDNDPFNANNAPGISLIVLLRIYDVMMALLKESNADVARELLQLHTTGALAGTTPSYIGEFLTDKLNL